MVDSIEANLYMVSKNRNKISFFDPQLINQFRINSIRSIKGKFLLNYLFLASLIKFL